MDAACHATHIPLCSITNKHNAKNTNVGILPYHFFILFFYFISSKMWITYNSEQEVSPVFKTRASNNLHFFPLKLNKTTRHFYVST